MKKKRDFSFFDHDKRPSKELKDLLQDDSLLSRYHTITNYLEKEGYAKVEENAQKIDGTRQKIRAWRQDDIITPKAYPLHSGPTRC